MTILLQRILGISGIAQVSEIDKTENFSSSDVFQSLVISPALGTLFVNQTTITLLVNMTEEIVAIGTHRK